MLKLIVLFIRFLLQYRINRVLMHHAYIIYTCKIIKTWIISLISQWFFKFVSLSLSIYIFRLVSNCISIVMITVPHFKTKEISICFL